MGDTTSRQDVRKIMTRETKRSAITNESCFRRVRRSKDRRKLERVLVGRVTSVEEES